MLDAVHEETLEQVDEIALLGILGGWALLVGFEFDNAEIARLSIQDDLEVLYVGLIGRDFVPASWGSDEAESQLFVHRSYSLSRVAEHFVVIAHPLFDTLLPPKSDCLEGTKLEVRRFQFGRSVVDPLSNYWNPQTGVEIARPSVSGDLSCQV
ncbi:MAG: hypothetical protein ACLQCB_02825 [Spirochaetia bacterium]